MPELRVIKTPLYCQVCHLSADNLQHFYNDFETLSAMCDNLVEYS